LTKGYDGASRQTQHTQGSKKETTRKACILIYIRFDARDAACGGKSKVRTERFWKHMDDANRQKKKKKKKLKKIYR
jgi:hypothetical protein